jgi:two-component system phosphate regulon sensor histidine kinase PhoR
LPKLAANIANVQKAANMPDKLLQAMLAAIPTPMLLISPDGNVAQANPAARELLGDWVDGRSYMTVLRQPAVLSKIEAALERREAGEARFVRTDQAGETIYRVVINSINHETLDPFGVVLHFTDITHLREVETMRSDFVANVSHELRTPLTAILGFIETLRGPAREDTEARHRFLAIMEDEARRMNRMVSDLLSLSQVEGQERMRPSEMVDLRQVVEGVVATLRPVAEGKDTNLSVACPSGTFLVKGDRDQLTQVFLNLIENGLKYGGAGKSVEIAIASAEGKDSLRGPMYRIDITDHGDGIDPLHLPRLTERFYRVDTHRSRAMGGTGLGLAIVKHIINRHRGRLRISSEKGQGSTFSVFLPKG